MTAIRLLALQQQIETQIPLTQALALQLQERQSHTLSLTAPLAPNCNDKGTMFAGSISTLCTLAGWALATLLAEDVGYNADVLAVKNQMHFIAPIQSEAQVVASVTPDSPSQIKKHLDKKQRARCVVTVEVTAAQHTCARFEGSYLVRAP